MTKIVIQQMPPGMRLTFEMPAYVKLHIAESVIAFGRIEQQFIEIAWLLKNHGDVKTRVKTARIPARNNFNEMMDLMEEAAGEKLDGLRRGLNELTDARNLIVHGSWLMAGEKPYVVWHKFLEDPDSVVGEFFETPRFVNFRRTADALLDMCQKYHGMLEEITGIKTSVMGKVV